MASKDPNASLSTHSNYTQSSYASFGQDYTPLARPAVGAGVNFSGTWRCVDVQGDIVRFLQDLGLEKEEAVNAADAYANLSHTTKIAQVGNTFVIQVMQQENVTTAFRVGAGAQPSSDQVGRALLIDPKWQEEVLVVHSVRADGTLISNSRRYLQGEKMVLCITTPAGSTIKRIFEKVLAS
eukprot:CAMPEP_0206630562 /NCGR_PEP_ID=MMETSP0325_2-20121206/67650_1 /ASSEMBLY_ACC=CAM_ASM_000347 /TAXON_ID=2866 /ORGANISM="Crypthecodinium cohnii, Strain Seligo" /LENGTH=180 /DNA_ID=CAMNT_0054155451 /DNA_START=261 /DNA_END=803 /DNA_ORIENTATION=-